MVSELKKMFGSPKGSVKASHAIAAIPTSKRTSRSSSNTTTAFGHTETPLSRKRAATNILINTKTIERKNPRPKHKEKREKITPINVVYYEEVKEEEITSYAMKRRKKNTNQEEEKEIFMKRKLMKKH